MNREKIWVTGASGFLGSTICTSAQNDFDITGFYFRNQPQLPQINLQQLDICNHDSVAALFKSNQPDYVFHAAAIANTTRCRMQPQLSEEVNVVATKHLAELCALHHSKLVFVSTDLVFDGTKAPYNEDDIPNPVMVYAQHKLLAEEAVMKASSQHLIIRIPLLIGRGSLPNKGYMASALKSMKSGKRVYLFEDEYRTPLSVSNAADGILKFRKESGILHLSGRERVSRYSLGVMIKEVFKLKDTKLVSTKSSEQTFSEPRPTDVSLDCTKALNLGFNVGTINDALHLTSIS